MFPATLFDYNGVLVDDEHVHLAAFREVLAGMKIAVSDEAYAERYIGFDDAGAFRAILENDGRAPSDSDIRALVDAKRPVYLRLAEGALRPFPGAAEAVRRRAACGPVVVVSGALRDEIELGLALMGVRELVAAIVAAEDAHASKPDPAGYRLGVAKIGERLGGESATRAVVIEDTVAGVRAAKATSLVCVAVEHSTPRADLENAGADLVVQTIQAVTEAALDGLYRRIHG